MGMFDSTPATTSPVDLGQDVFAAEQTQETNEEQQDFSEENHEEIEEEQQDEQYEETEEEPAEEQPSQEEQGGELIAGKFKTTEDLVKAYKNLEREFHKSRQAAKEQPAQQAQAPIQQQTQPQDELNAIFQDYWEQNPAGVLQYMMENLVDQRIKQLQEQYINPIQEARQTEMLANNIGELSNQYGQLMTEEGLTALFQQVQDIAAEIGNPDLAKNPTKRILRMAASELWGEPSKVEMYQRGKEAARQASEQTRRQKQALATKTTKKPKEQPKTEEDAIREAILNAGYRSGGIFG